MPKDQQHQGCNKQATATGLGASNVVGFKASTRTQDNTPAAEQQHQWECAWTERVNFQLAMGVHYTTQEHSVRMAQDLVIDAVKLLKLGRTDDAEATLGLVLERTHNAVKEFEGSDAY
jgi:hypothetical protein